MLSGKVWPKLHAPLPTGVVVRMVVGGALSLSSSAAVRGRDKVLAIRREESSVWERRAPLSPYHVHSMVKKGIKVSMETVILLYSLIIMQTFFKLMEEKRLFLFPSFLRFKGLGTRLCVRAFVPCVHLFVCLLSIPGAGAAVQQASVLHAGVREGGSHHH